MLKLPVYLREQIGHVWLVDPQLRSVEVLRNEGGQWVLAATCVGEEKVCLEPFPDHELELGTLWLPGEE